LPEYVAIENTVLIFKSAAEGFESDWAN